MGKTKNEPLTSEQITDARRLCEVIKGIPSGKRTMFEIVILTYMNGMEAGMMYAQNTKATK